MTATVALSPSPILQFFDNLGNPAAGGSVLTQVGGVNYATYQDVSGSIALPNPIPLNSRGEVSNASGISCQLFLAEGITYTFTLYDTAGNQLNQSTSVAAPPSIAQLAGSGGSALVGFIQAGTGAVATTVQAKAREIVSLDDFDTFAHAYTYVKSVNGILAIPASGSARNLPAVTLDGSDTEVVGLGGQAILQSTAASGNAITIGNAAGMAHFAMRNISLLGNANADAGIGVGINTGSAAIVLARFEMENVAISLFTKATAVLLPITYAVEGTLINVTAEGGAYGGQLLAITTTICFISCNFRITTVAGFYTGVGATGCSWFNCVFESNYSVGLWLHGGADNSWYKSWFEGNNRTTNATPKFNYQICIDSGVDGPYSFHDLYLNGAAANSIGDIYIDNTNWVRIHGVTTWITNAQNFIYNNGGTNCDLRVSEVVYKETGTGANNVGWFENLQTYSLLTLGNIAMRLFLTDGAYLVRDKTNGLAAIFNLHGTGNGADLVAGSAGWSATIGNAATRNVGYSSGAYRLENNTVGTVAFEVIGLNGLTS